MCRLEDAHLMIFKNKKYEYRKIRDHYQGNLFYDGKTEYGTMLLLGLQKKVQRMTNLGLFNAMKCLFKKTKLFIFVSQVFSSLIKCIIKHLLTILLSCIQ